MNIFKKIFNYFKKPKVVPETHNTFKIPEFILSDEYDRALKINGYCVPYQRPFQKKLPLRDSRGRFTKKEENV